MPTSTERAPVRPGRVSARRPVPPQIRRPEYVDRPRAARWTGGEIKDAATVAAMREACRLAADALQAVGRAVAPGVTTEELDEVGHEYLVSRGAYPSTLGYPGHGAPPFPKSLCTSVNEVICHGIPDDTALTAGDIVNVDITAYLVTNGIAVHGDTNATFLVGGDDAVSEDVRLLVERTREATLRGIRAALPGRRLNVIGRVIEKYADRFGYGDVAAFTGHGIGEAFHSGIVVPHYDAAPDYDTLIEPGMTFTVEPMLTLGASQHVLWDDGWTAVTVDGSWSAQFEHTVLITESGPEILTVPTDGDAPGGLL
ncbi:type I methionyl aminopeptidase [Aquipuribacter nitratireducens]|uniref:Methionine aminopeptidase n=1 Tax=Aquipuribacter nitratireducens TaxID=650104 RepID=A0ABW0GKC8_9MICO